MQTLKKTINIIIDVLIIVMLIFSAVVAGLAIGMEFKDYEYSNKFDWLDVIATMLGGIIGQIIQILILWIFLYLY